VRCLALAVLRQHVAVALGFVAVALALGIVALVKTKAVTTFYFFFDMSVERKS